MKNATVIKEMTIITFTGFELPKKLVSIGGFFYFCIATGKASSAKLR
ncbi:MAG: hypothetical protein ACJARZ_002284 [Dokdonia sp.]|jgi:hypothetical protein